MLPPSQQDGTVDRHHSKHRVRTATAPRPFVVCPALACPDLRAYAANDGSHFLLRFQHALPSEDPWGVPHLGPGSSDARSLFVRLLRPEFVRAFPQPLSPDGLRSIADRPVVVKVRARVGAYRG